MPNRKALIYPPRKQLRFRHKLEHLSMEDQQETKKNENDISLEQMGRKPVGKEKWSTSDRRQFVCFICISNGWTRVFVLMESALVSKAV